MDSNEVSGTEVNVSAMEMADFHNRPVSLSITRGIWDWFVRTFAKGESDFSGVIYSMEHQSIMMLNRLDGDASKDERIIGVPVGNYLKVSRDHGNGNWSQAFYAF